MAKSEDEDTEGRYLAASGVETRSASVKVDGVDFGQRIITVLAMPYEQVTQVPFRGEVWNEVFSRSAFQGIEHRQTRIPATAVLDIPAPDHQGGRLVGRVIRTDPNAQEGLIADIKVSRTALGDEALELAEALSASVGFVVKDPRRDQRLDRGTRTRRVDRAFLDHLALVGQPAYPGTRVLATRSEGGDDGAEKFTPTPQMDRFLEDPILRWAAEKCGNSLLT